MNRTYDVVVIGGGPAGCGAALAAARSGASALLVEKTNCLGGTLTNGLVSMIRTAGDGGGIVRELWDRLAHLGCAEITDTHAWIDPFAARVVLLQLVEQAGVDLLLHSHLAAAAVVSGCVTGVRVAGKDGIAEIECRVAVDASGDGDLAFLAGAPFDKGRDGDGFLQAVSLNFVLAGIDEEILPSREAFEAASSQALADGRVELAPPAHGFGCGHARPGYPAGVRHFQCDLALDVDGSDPRSLTAGERQCHQRVFAIWKFLRDTFPAYRHSIVIDVASHLGIREGRRIRGEATLTEAMVMAAAKFPDGVSRCSWYMDLHDGQDKRPLAQYRAARRPPEGDYYEIPYGCLVPREIDQLLVSGRCVSSTRPANGSLRLQPTCMNLGQAAGTAAALCALRSRPPRQIDGTELRAMLQEQGMEL